MGCQVTRRSEDRTPGASRPVVLALLLVLAVVLVGLWAVLK
jgi:hypothetical protein